jgi:hypothetical protein
MNRLHGQAFRILCLAAGALLSAGSSLRAQDPKAAKPKELVLSPAPEPAPALRYRLLPVSSELNPGNAAPVYLRIRHELNDERWKQIDEKSNAWSNLPLDKLPLEEARKFVESWEPRLKLLEYGTRREFCDWDYTVREQKLEVIQILLPDCQSMRQWGRVLAIKARLEIAERKYDQAIETIETGLAFGRHVSEGPFIINNLVGSALCSVMVAAVEELVEQPDAPNLYWALSALPRPLVGMRMALETEQRLGENMIPELTMVDESHTRAEWSILLEKLYERLRNLASSLTGDAQVNAKLKAQLDLELDAFRKENVEPSRKFLLEQRHLDPRRVKLMSDDELVARALVGQYRDMRDDLFKLGYLPWREARVLGTEVEKRIKAVKPGPLTIFAEIQPSLMACLLAEVRLDRRVASLRVLEAIRLHAAAHDGKLPRGLDEIKEVPLPDDPATGKPFLFHREGDVVLLSAQPGLIPAPGELSYRITIRKRDEAKR